MLEVHPLARAGGVAAAQVVCTTAALFIVYRLVTHRFGLAALGLWSSAAALASLVVIFDGGLVDIMVRQIAEAAGRDQWARARGLHRTLTACAAVGLGAGALLVAPAVRTVLATAAPAAAAASLDGLLWGAVAVGCLNPIAIAQLGVLEALGRYDLKLWIALAVGTAMVAAAVVAEHSAASFGLAGVFVAGGLTNVAIAGWLARRLLRQRSAEAQRIGGAEILALVRFAIPVRLAGLLTLGLEPVTRIALVRFGGAELAALYELAYRLVFQLRSVIVAGLQTLVPYLARRRARAGETPAQLVVHSALCAGIVSVPLLSLALAGLPLLSLVIVGRPVPRVGLYGGLLAAGWLVNIVTVPFYFANLASGHVHRNWVAQATLCGLNVALAPLAGWWLGDVGVVAATSVAVGLGSLVALKGWPGAGRALLERLSSADWTVLAGSAATALVVTVAATLQLSVGTLVSVDAGVVGIFVVLFGRPLLRRSLGLLRAVG